MTTANRWKVITERQRDVLNFFVDSVIEKMRPPTIREICGLLGASGTNSAVTHLKALERKGYLIKDPSDSKLYRWSLSPKTILEYGINISRGNDTVSLSQYKMLQGMFETANQRAETFKDELSLLLEWGREYYDASKTCGNCVNAEVRGGFRDPLPEECKGCTDENGEGYTKFRWHPAVLLLCKKE